MKVKLHPAMPLNKEYSKNVRKYTEACTGFNSKTASVGHIPTEGADARPNLQRATHVLLKESNNIYSCD